MNEYKMCTQCIMHTGIPGIKLNDEGICNDCLDFIAEKENIKDKSKQEKYIREMEDLFERAKSNKSGYDAIVLFSGGKDSTQLLYMASRVYKLKVLAFAMILPIGKPQAVMNMDEVAKKLNVDLIKVSPNEEMYKRYMHYALVNGDRYGLGEHVGCAACSFLFRWYAYKLAISMEIPIILDGRDKWQYGGVLFDKGADVKNKVINGEKTFGQLHDLYSDAFGNDGDESFFGFNRDELIKKDFPTLIAPYTFMEYDTLDSFETIEMLGLNKDNFETMFTNCDGVYLFDYITLKRYNCTSYHKGYAHGIRQNIPTITQLNVGEKKDAVGMSKEMILKVLDEYKQVLFYIAEKKLTKKNISDKDKDIIRSMIQVSKQVYGTQAIDIFINRFLALTEFAEYFNIDLDKEIA